MFQNDLFIKEVGQCKLKSGNTKSYELKSCAYNYYEKTEADYETTEKTGAYSPTENRAVMLNSALLLSLSVVISFAFVAL